MRHPLRAALLGVLILCRTDIPAAEEPPAITQTVINAAEDAALPSADNRAAAERLIEHVTYARIALAMKDIPLARQHLKRADNLNAILINSVPAPAPEGKDGALRLEDILPSTELRFPLGERRAEWRKLERAPFWSRADGVAVRKVELVSMALTMNTADITRRLAAADGALDRGDRAAADAALAALVKKSVRLDKVAELPLRKAQDNIALARHFIDAGDYASASHALNHAIDGLRMAEGDRRYTHHRAEIAALRGEVARFRRMADERRHGALRKARGYMESWWGDRRVQPATPSP